MIPPAYGYWRHPDYGSTNDSIAPVKPSNPHATIVSATNLSGSTATVTGASDGVVAPSATSITTAVNLPPHRHFVPCETAETARCFLVLLRLIHLPCGSQGPTHRRGQLAGAGAARRVV